MCKIYIKADVLTIDIVMIVSREIMQQVKWIKQHNQLWQMLEN